MAVDGLGDERDGAQTHLPFLLYVGSAEKLSTSDSQCSPRLVVAPPSLWLTSVWLQTEREGKEKRVRDIEVE